MTATHAPVLPTQAVPRQDALVPVFATEQVFTEQVPWFEDGQRTPVSPA